MKNEKIFDKVIINYDGDNKINNKMKKALVDCWKNVMLNEESQYMACMIIMEKLMRCRSIKSFANKLKELDELIKCFDYYNDYKEKEDKKMLENFTLEGEKIYCEMIMEEKNEIIREKMKNINNLKDYMDVYCEEDVYDENGEIFTSIYENVYNCNFEKVYDEVNRIYNKNNDKYDEIYNCLMNFMYFLKNFVYK